jgi:acyl-coenzyme A thioesterase PaaI-like protein
MISALLDELMGRLIWVKEPQTFGVTTTLNITYRKPVPLETPVKARASMVFDSARGMSAVGQLYDMDNNLLAEGSCKYFKLPFEKVFGEGYDMHEELCYVPDIDLEQIEFPIE